MDRIYTLAKQITEDRMFETNNLKSSIVSFLLLRAFLSPYFHLFSYLPLPSQE